MNSALGPGGKKDSESSFNSEKICKNAAQKSVDNLFGTLDQRGKQTLNAQDDIGANCDTKRAENRTLLEDSSSDGENDDEIETFLKPPVQEISPPDIRSPDLFTLPSHPRSIAICYVPNTNCENAAQNYVGDLSGATDQSEKHRLNGQEDAILKHCFLTNYTDLSTDQDSSKAERDQESLDASEINHPQRNRKIQKKRRRQHRTRASSSAVVLPCGAKTQAWAVDMVEAKKKQKRKSNEVEVSKSLYDASGDNHGVIQQRRSGKPGGHLFPFLETKDSNRSVKKTSKENKAKRQIKPADVLDFLTQSSETASEDSELPYSNYRNAIFLTEQLGLGGKDSVNVSKKGETLLFYKRLLELNRYHYELLAQKNERRKAKVSGLLKLLSESKEIQSQLKHQKEEWEQELYTVRSTLKKEEEKRRTTDLLCEELRQQLRKTIGQNSKEVEVRQQLELTLQSLNRELSALRNELNQVTEERDDSQRQLAVEQNARALQERIAKDHYSRQKDLEESYKKVKSMVSEGGKKEKDLLHKNHMLQDRVSILKQELRKLSHQGQEKERKYFEDIKVLQEKNHALQDTIEQNEEASTEKIIQYTRQLDALKAENITLNTTLEDEKQNKARLETEVESYCSRLAAVLCNQDPSQTSRNDLEVTFQRAKDEWLNLQDHLTFQVSSLKASNKILSQQLFKAESKSNSLETELQHTGDALRQKTSTVECLQKELCRIHCQKKELEREYDNQQNLLNEHIRKQESLEGQLSEIQNENVLLQCQLDAAHSKASKKEKTVMSIHDGFWDVKRRNQAEPEDQCLTQEERNKELINECNCSKQTVCPCENEKAQREELVRKLEQELAGSRKKQSTAEVVSYYLIKLEDERRDFKKKVDDLTSELQIASSKCLHLDAHNQVLQQEISYMTATRKKCGKLKKHNSELEQEIVNLKSHIGKMMEKYGQVEQSKRELEERSRHNLAEILRAVELFLQKRASSPRYVEQRKENGTASMSNQVDLRVKNLESEFSKMKISHEVSKEAEIEKCKVQIEYLISELSTVKMSQEMSKKAQLGKYEPLFIEEVKVKNSLENKPKWTHEHPAVKFGAKFVEKDLNKPLLFTLPTRPGLNPLLVGSPNYTSLTFNRNCFSRETFAGSTSSLRPSFNSKENCYLTKMEEALDVSTAGEVAEGSMKFESGPKDFLI
ncbi:ankyrin repeat domain-containing protein 26-like [Erinaceus europaeus]|uniref:Ankyrin repeat domain-containing protein 26-like n=1 Tax=Erinaceus europaeus TaxID=9365 RepID=A0ABM3XGZ6_ERIEU|nr:ankyrin repeat domain-containing protein 26-like [Erinaceus europaeus]